MTKCPIYTVGDGKRTQIACREDGVWFMRRRDVKGWMWGPWKRQKSRPFEGHAYIDARAGNARLPKGDDDACQSGIDESNER